MHESKVSRNNSSYKSSSSAISHSSSSVTSNVGVHNNNNNNNSTGGGAGATNKKDGKHGSGKKRSLENDENSTSAMSNINTYSLIDDDHIDDQETINVGNLIIDLESDLEKEKRENEQASTKPDTCTTLANSSTSAYTLGSSPNLCNTITTPATQTRASSSSSTPTTTSTKNQSGSRSSQKSSSKHSSSNSASNKNSSNASSANTTNNNITSNNTNNIINDSNDGSNGSIINSSTIGIANNAIGTANDNNHVMTTRTVFKSSADERGELKMRITRETKPGKSEHKIITSPNHQRSPISSSSTGQTISGDETTMAIDELDKVPALPTSPQLKQSQTQKDLSSISSTKECGTSTSIGTITEPECLGPCEPGTSVTLEGIVWQETEGGILVVNVTWRGKTYVGALLDCTRHDWAPPRLCDSPASDIDLKSSKGVRPKRIVTRSNGIGVDEKNLLQTTGKLRNGKGRRILNDPATSNKRQRETDKPNENSASEAAGNSSASLSQSESSVPMKVDTPSTPSNQDKSNSATTAVSSTSTAAAPSTATSSDKLFIDKGPSSPMLIGCTEPNCSKKYRNMNGLLYHQTHAHGADSELKAPGSPPTATPENAFAATPTTETLATASTSNAQIANPDTSKFSGAVQERPKVVSQARDAKSPFGLQNVKEKLSPDPKRFHRSDSSSPTPRLDANLKLSAKPGLPRSNISMIEPNQRHGSAPLMHEASPRSSNAKVTDSERRSSLNSNHSSSNMNDLIIHPQQPSNNRISPSAPRQQPSFVTGGPPPVLPPLGPQVADIGQPSGSHHPLPPQTKSSSSKQQQQHNQSQPPPLPATTEEGMKPSGTSTGPPPAPHQANCYFNSAFLANSYAYALPPYFPRQMFDPVTPPSMPPSPAFLSRFMNNIRPPPPADSPSRMLSPSLPKNLQFTPYKIDPSTIPLSLPNSQFLPNPPLPHNISSMTNSPLPGGSPHLRMPSHADPMLPPTSQPPFLPPTSVNPTQGLPGPANPPGPLGPQVPSLVEDPMKQFPRRFN